ncbi:hypothetical protein FRB90_008689, partial [Tulasnella sp. 427]
MLPTNSDPAVGPIRHQPHRHRPPSHAPGQPYYYPSSYSQAGSFGLSNGPSTPSHPTAPFDHFPDDSPHSFATRTPSFSGPESGGELGFASIGPTPAGFAGQVATEFGLDEADRKVLHEIANTPPLMRELRLHGSLMALRREQRALKERLDNQDQTLRSLEQLVRTEWKPTNAQKNVLRDLMRHYTIKSVGSYAKLPEETLKYVVRKADSLRMPNLQNDLVMREALKEILRNEATEQKSAIRKLIFGKCGQDVDGTVISGPPLVSMVTSIWDDWHFGSYTTPISGKFLARFALLRNIATPIVRRRRANGATTRGDTGFWQAVENELAKIKKYSVQERMNWEAAQMKSDAELHPPDGEEFDLNIGEDMQNDDDNDDNDDTTGPDTSRLQARIAEHDASTTNASGPPTDMEEDDDVAPTDLKLTSLATCCILRYYLYIVRSYFRAMSEVRPAKPAKPASSPPPTSVMASRSRELDSRGPSAGLQ